MDPKTPILLIEDDAAQARTLAAMLSRGGAAVEIAPNGAAGLAALRVASPPYGAVLLDLGLPDMTGLEVLAALRPDHPDLPVVVLTADGSVARAVAAMRAGADDFLIKPAVAERIEVSLSNAMRMRDLDRSVRALKGEGVGEGFAGLIADAPATKAAIRLAARGAGSTIPILIEGESGVGKEVFARAIHAASTRAGGPFVAVNCGAIPETLIESILFGHEKGAFTGAVARRVGKFEEADGGTLFLDEVGELPPEGQVALLRALQEGEIDPVGGSKTIRTDIRVISATNRRLAGEVAAGRFREDLYYRLSVFPLDVPPLRERRDDILPLAIRFAARFATQEGTRFERFDEDAAARLRAAHWPGNVRQLENTVFRAVVLARGPVIGSDDLRLLDVAAPAPRGADGDKAADHVPQAPRDRFLADSGDVRPLSEIEAEAVRFALARYDGRVTEVARRLRIGRSTLYRKMDEIGFHAADAQTGGRPAAP